ncbi:hypothetical protein C8R43DRAFT_554957 [Mycena crocata]|nr:hypothetical protein C8R43DRAFT_554957 [Mycena crocata]
MDANAGPLPGQEPNFELLFAPLLIGVVLNALLFGVFMVLVHSYFRLYKTDLSWIRYLIYYLILLETINTICDIALIYEPLIKMHNNPLVTVNSPKFLVADPVVTTLISTPTQLFMAWRIRLVTKKTWLAAVVALLAFTSLVGGTVASIGVAHEGTFQKFHLVSGPLTVWLTSTAFADLFITAFLCNFLWSNQTGFKTTTDSVTNKIIFFTVQTGTLTSFAAIADVTLFLIVPNTTLMFIWDFSLSKLYSICLIATSSTHAQNGTPSSRSCRGRPGARRGARAAGVGRRTGRRTGTRLSRFGGRQTSSACSSTSRATSRSPPRRRRLPQSRVRYSTSSSRRRG